MDRIGKTLLLFPLTIILDMLSTFWAMLFGAQEANPLPRFFINVFGNLGLVLHTIIFLLIALLWVAVALRWKSATNWKQRGILRFSLGILFVVVFMATSFWMGIVIRNFLFPLSLNAEQNTYIHIISEISIFLGALWFTRKELSNFLSKKRVAV